MKAAAPLDHLEHSSTREIATEPPQAIGVPALPGEPRSPGTGTPSGSLLCPSPPEGAPLRGLAPGRGAESRHLRPVCTPVCTPRGPRGTCPRSAPPRLPLLGASHSAREHDAPASSCRLPVPGLSPLWPRPTSSLLSAPCQIPPLWTSQCPPSPCTHTPPPLQGTPPQTLLQAPPPTHQDSRYQ